MKTVALEDLVSCVLLNFMSNLKGLGWDGKGTVEKWYMGLSEKELYSLSGKLLGIMAPPKGRRGRPKGKRA